MSKRSKLNPIADNKIDRKSWSAIVAGLNNLDQGFLLVDANFVLVAANRAFFNILDIPETFNEPGKTTAADIYRFNAIRGEYGSGDIEELVAERIHLAEQNVAHSFERTLPDGRVIEVSGNPIEGGGFVSIFKDITKQRISQTALNESQDLFRTAFNSSHAIATITEVQTGKYVDVNQSFLSTFDFKREDVIGKTALDLNVWGEMGNRQRMLDDLASLGGLSDYPAAAYTRTGEPRTLILNLNIIELDDRGFLYLSATDTTEQEAAEGRLRAAKENAENANRSKSEFLAAMSHDLRTPLNAIIGFADMINQQYFGLIGDKYLGYSKDIKSSGELLLSLINDILDLSVIESGKRQLAKESIPAIDVVTECNVIIKEKALSGCIDLVTNLSEGLLSIYADRRAVMQIILNLLSNSIKYTPEGGKVTLSLSAKKKHCIIEVKDTGIGIPGDKIGTLTDPFIRVETNPYKTQEGSGLGLAIVKSLVDLHDGEMEINSTVGKGTVVTISLPNDVF